MGLGTSLEKLGKESVDAVKGIGGSIPNVFKKSKPTAAVNTVERSGFSYFMQDMGGTATNTMKGSAKGALWLIEQPFVFLTNVAGGTIRRVGNFYRNHPKGAWATTAVVAVAGIASWMGNRAERQSQDYYNAQAAALQTAAINQQNQVNPYKLQAGEFTETVQPLLKENGQNGGASFADRQKQASESKAEAVAATAADNASAPATPAI